MPVPMSWLAASIVSMNVARQRRERKEKERKEREKENNRTEGRNNA